MAKPINASRLYSDKKNLLTIFFIIGFLDFFSNVCIEMMTREREDLHNDPAQYLVYY